MLSEGSEPFENKMFDFLGTLTLVVKKTIDIAQKRSHPTLCEFNASLFFTVC